MKQKESLGVHGEWTFYYDDGTVVRHENKVVNHGLSTVAKMLTGEISNTNIPFYMALGMGITPVGGEDTQLEDEQYRKIVSSQSTQGGVVRFRFLLQANEGNGDWSEFGMFVGGTALKDSGSLFNRVVRPISKTDITMMTVEVRITFRRTVMG